jgi:thioredoxin reductase (NADPH)
MDYDLIIIGGGPAGMSAAVYAVRSGLNVAVITKKFGGRILWAHNIENYLGLKGVTGEKFMEKAVEHARSMGAKIIEDEVMDCGTENELFFVKTAKNKKHRALAVIIATGIQDKLLKVPGEKELVGKGVSYCATCDGFFFKGQEVVVVGGGNAAVHAAIFLKNIASNIKLIAEEMSASENMLDELKKNKIEIINGKVDSIEGKDEVTGIVVEGKKIPVSGVFIELGTTALINLAAQFGFNMKDERFIEVDEKQATTKPGVYAAGDVTGGLLQVITAAYQGAVAALSAHNYIHKKKQTNL